SVSWSDDRGESWHECEQLSQLPTTKGWTGPVPPHVSRMKAISLHPDEAGAIYGAIEEGWAVRSLDGGASWNQMQEGVDHDSHDVAVMVDDRNTVLITGGKGIYRSQDRGDTWNHLDWFEGRYRYTPAPMVR